MFAIQIMTVVRSIVILSYESIDWKRAVLPQHDENAFQPQAFGNIVSTPIHPREKYSLIANSLFLINTKLSFVFFSQIIIPQIAKQGQHNLPHV